MESDQSLHTYAYSYVTDLKNYPDIKIVKTFREYTPISFAYGLQEDSEFRELFNYIFVKMAETGLMAQIFQAWFFSSSNHQKQQQQTLMEYNNVFVPFMVVVFGIVISIFILLGEQLPRLFNDPKPKLIQPPEKKKIVINISK